MLMTRPQPFLRIAGSAALVAWKAAERLMAMMASQRSSGNDSIGATYWMPALFTSTSKATNFASASFTMRAISAGLDMSARSEEDKSELQAQHRISYADFGRTKKL